MGEGNGQRTAWRFNLEDSYGTSGEAINTNLPFLPSDLKGEKKTNTKHLIPKLLGYLESIMFAQSQQDILTTLVAVPHPKSGKNYLASIWIYPEISTDPCLFSLQVSKHELTHTHTLWKRTVEGLQTLNLSN